MKRGLLAVATGAMAAMLVASIYSPAFVGVWHGHQSLQMILTYAGIYPVFFAVAPVMRLFGVDSGLSPLPLVVAAFVQWLVAGYVMAGVVFRDRMEQSSPGGLR